MNEPLLPEVLSHRDSTTQRPLPLSTKGALPYVWQHRYGSKLIVVVGDEVRVNGEAVRREATDTSLEGAQ